MKCFVSLGRETTQRQIIIHLNFIVPFSESTLPRRNLKTQLSFYRQASVAYTLIRYENGAFQKRSSNLNINILKPKLFQNDDVTIVMRLLRPSSPQTQIQNELCPTSFPGSLILPPLGREGGDPGNEVELCQL